MINLAGIAAPGIGPVWVQVRAALLCLRHGAGGPIFVGPIQPLDRTGSGNLESVAGSSAMATAAKMAAAAIANTPDTPTGLPWGIRTLSHAAIHVHSLFV